MAEIDCENFRSLAYWETKVEIARTEADKFLNAICEAWSDKLVQFQTEPVLSLIVDSLTHGRMRANDERARDSECTEEKTFFLILEFRELQNKGLPLNFLSQKEIPGYNNFRNAKRWAITIHQSITSYIEIVVTMCI
jgi:hypothetical protein